MIVSDQGRIIHCFEGQVYFFSADVAPVFTQVGGFHVVNVCRDTLSFFVDVGIKGEGDSVFVFPANGMVSPIDGGQQPGLREVQAVGAGGGV